MVSETQMAVRALLPLWSISFATMTQSCELVRESVTQKSPVAVCLRRNFAEHEIDFAVSQRLETGLVGFKGDELNFKVIGLGDRREHIHMHSGARAVRLLKLKRRRVRV